MGRRRTVAALRLGGFKNRLEGCRVSSKRRECTTCTRRGDSSRRRYAINANRRYRFELVYYRLDVLRETQIARIYRPILRIAEWQSSRRAVGTNNKEIRAPRSVENGEANVLVGWGRAENWRSGAYAYMFFLLFVPVRYVTRFPNEKIPKKYQITIIR